MGKLRLFGDRKRPDPGEGNPDRCGGQAPDRWPLDYAHVLYLDVVGYSTRSIGEQSRVVRQLQDLVRACPAYTAARGDKAVLSLPAGDGLALVFFGNPERPARCAIELTSALAEHPEMQLRMGVHSGPVSRLKNINAHPDVAGSGINLAQRVMACGDAGHILLSGTYARSLRDIGTWSDHLHDLCPVLVKHEEVVELVNFFGSGVGNPTTPQSVVQQVTATRPDPPLARVALLHAWHVATDERLVAELERRLEADGVSVFLDHRLVGGAAWSQRLEAELTAADAVIVLLSEQAVHDEMLAYELEICHQARGTTGRPRLLPVRVDYDGLLPEPLASMLDQLPQAQWHGDDVTEVHAWLSEALRPGGRHAAPAPVLGLSHLPAEAQESVGGAVPLNSPYYLERDADCRLEQAVGRRDSIVLIKGARQIGKTSLMSRGIQQARRDGAVVAVTDLQKLNANQFKSISDFYQAIGGLIAEQLDLEHWPEDEWNDRRAPNLNFELYLRRRVLGASDRPLVWAIDEADRLFTCSFGSDVFGLIRSWHNERSLDPHGPWGRISLIITYATEASLFITDANQSPFNVGTPIGLADFTASQVGELNTRCGGPLADEDELARFMNLVGGHPYLVRRGLLEMARQQTDIGHFESIVLLPDGPFHDHLRRMLALLCRDAALTETVRGILRGGPCDKPLAFFRLRAAGLMVGSHSSEPTLRCRLYRDYLRQHLL